MKKILFHLIMSFTMAQIQNLAIAQCGNPDIVCMQDGYGNICSGTFMDNSGDAPYADSPASFTLFPVAAGYKSVISFTEFDLDAGTSEVNQDKLLIYDGSSSDDQLIGIYTGNVLLGQTITATNGNPTGSLFFEFVTQGVANASHTGWIASISCAQPCIPPVAVASVTDALFENNIYLKCLYEEISFSAAGSTAAEGQSIMSYEWDFKDGNNAITTNEIAMHTYSNDNIYEATLVVTDDVGCASITSLNVGIVGPPEIDVPSNIEVCAGAEVSLPAIFSPVSIDNNPSYENNETLYIADGAGFSYNSEIQVFGFSSSTTIGSCIDIEAIRLNIEHSYMGDLNVALTCPNGTSINLVEWGVNGGGGTFLGEALDNENADPGIGYDYWWSPTAGNGTWGENSGGGTLPSGTYEPSGSFCDFIGCPINGTWVITVTDNLAIDNGYIFGWGISMSTENSPLSYTPTIDEDAVSSYWSGDVITALDENADVATLNTANLGTLYLQYTTIDNAGCTYSEEFSIDVIENPIVISLNNSFEYYGGNTVLYANSSGLEGSNALQWQWLPADGLEYPNSPYTEVLIPNDNEAYTLVVSSLTLLGCITNEYVNMIYPELVLSGFIFYDENENGIFDEGEEPLPFFPYANGAGTIQFSDEDGYYSAYCTYGTNTVALIADPDLWTTTTPTSFTTALDDNQNESINNNFGIVPNGNSQTILNGQISNSNTWCMFENTQNISVSNDGNTQPAGYIIYTIDEQCTYISADPAPYLIDGNNLYFSFESLGFAATAFFNVVLDMPDNAENGDQLFFNLQTFYFDGLDEQLVETDPVVSTLLCSYDPNDKRELNGEGDLGMLAPNTTLDYVVRFQNTGTATAFDVVISDQLPSQLVFNTLDPVASSHPFTASVSEAGLATFVFDNIMLPDSGSNFEGSIGFIHFRIDQQQNLPNGTVINNDAQIFFDMNSPITTNETTTTIFQCESNELNISVEGVVIEILDAVSEVQWFFNGSPMLNIGYTITATQTGVYYAVATLQNGCIATSTEVSIVGLNELVTEQFELYPNPANDITNLLLGATPSDVIITNSLGQSVLFISNLSGLSQIDCSLLQSGSYIIQIKNELSNQRLKLVVE
ncbi:MAG: PKD domain-containing protein [Flavobacteriales bacterium]